MGEVLRYDDIVPYSPLEAGVIHALLGKDAGKSGVYGPTVRTTFSYGSYKLDLDALLRAEGAACSAMHIQYPASLGRIHIN